MFDVVVSNHGEDAFETTLQIKYPEGVYYKKHETREGQHVLCSPLQNNTIECQIGNPLQAGKIVLKPSFHPSYTFNGSLTISGGVDRAVPAILQGRNAAKLRIRYVR